MKTVALMQPYFLPYLGYWQLMEAVDTFVIYDNIKFTKQGWINRNRILARGVAELMTLPLVKASDSADICDRFLVPHFSTEANRILRKVRAAYAEAPHLTEGMAVLEKVMTHSSTNLYEFLLNSIRVVAESLGLRAEIVTSSLIGADHSKKGEDRVIDICRCLGAKVYINPPGGRSLYSHDSFLKASVELKFLEPQILPYKQPGVEEFIPNLSIIDCLMAVGWNDVINKLGERRIIQ